MVGIYQRSASINGCVTYTRDSHGADSPLTLFRHRHEWRIGVLSTGAGRPSGPRCFLKADADATLHPDWCCSKQGAWSAFDKATKTWSALPDLTLLSRPRDPPRAFMGWGPHHESGYASCECDDSGSSVYDDSDTFDDESSEESDEEIGEESDDSSGDSLSADSDG